MFLETSSRPAPVINIHIYNTHGQNELVKRKPSLARPLRAKPGAGCGHDLTSEAPGALTL